MMKISGERVKALGKGFFETDEAMIPYHRILRIEYDGETLFERNGFVGARALGDRSQ